MWNEENGPSFLNWKSVDGEFDRPLERHEFEPLWNRVERVVRAFARAWLGRTEWPPRPDAVDDMVQDAAVALLRAIEVGRIRASASVVKAWLWTTMFNLAMARSKLRRRWRLASFHSEDDDVEGLNSRLPVAPSAEGEVEARGLLRQVLSAVDPKDAAIFEAWAEGAEPKEIAALFHMNPSTVRVRLHRARFAARKAIRGDLNARGQPEEGYVDSKNIWHLRRKLRNLGQGALTKSRKCGNVSITLDKVHGSRDASLRRLGLGRLWRKYSALACVARTYRCSIVLLPLTPPATNGATMSNIDKSMFLGCGEGPEPVWRDAATDADNWPAGATFKIFFTAENSPGASVTQCQLPRTEFFGPDGWPLELPVERKATLSDELKREFQVFPSNWRHWADKVWSRAARAPHRIARLRARGAALRILADQTSRLACG
jgi:RNA polymerase sigma-70 factor (ECF subfamily)